MVEDEAVTAANELVAEAQEPAYSAEDTDAGQERAEIIAARGRARNGCRAYRCHDGSAADAFDVRRQRDEERAAGAARRPVRGAGRMPDERVLAVLASTVLHGAG